MPFTTPSAITEFWAETAKKTLKWIEPWESIVEGDFTQGQGKWFKGGKLNASVNCIDRHLAEKGDSTAIFWEGDAINQSRTLTFNELHEAVCRMANVLKNLGIKKGDTVAIYLPMIPEAAIAMLACARIGAIHTVVFAGFSALALRQRMLDCHCKLLISADAFQRGGKTFFLKAAVDEALQDSEMPRLLIKNSALEVTFNPARDHWWHALSQTVSKDCLPEAMDAEDPLFILYTSGSTGKPKGVLHTTGGYLLEAAWSHQQVFGCQSGEVFWCTADVGWITGHSYVVYGPLCNGIGTLMYAGIPTWPDPSRYWQIIDKYQVKVFYTAPTAIRSLMREGDAWLSTSKRDSLRMLGSVGEPINPEVWHWYHQQVGMRHCDIVDTWWQTETGAIMISPRAGQPAKPGSATRPLPGIEVLLLDAQGKAIVGEGEGLLAIKYPWPSLARTIYGNNERYCQAYYAYGYYITGDGARRDKEGDYWITGRMDDVLNVSGHRLGTAEIESALVSHPQVAEAAVVGIDHEIKGQAVYAFVVLKAGFLADPALYDALMDCVKNQIGSIAKPETIQWVQDLPKTRSGKIMRRILRHIAGKDFVDIERLGDLSTLANPKAVQDLVANSIGEKKDEHY